MKKEINHKYIEEEKTRKKFILQVLVLGSIILSLVATIVSFINYYSNKQYNALSPFLYLLVPIFFIIILFLIKKDHIKLASFLFIMSYLLPNTLFAIKWGVDLPQVLLFYVLIIVITGILINTTYTFITTAVIGTTLMIISYLQQRHIINTDLYWTKYYEPRIDDTFIIFMTLVIIAIVSWLANREIKKLLHRARKSEQNLEKERNDLEMTVKARTLEIIKLQTEKINTLYRLAEFGKLSSGIFHDLINPLTAVSLNLQQIKNKSLNTQKINHHLMQALVATEKMQDFISSIKSQIKSDNTNQIFSINKETSNCIQILNYKAKKCGVNIINKNHKQIDVIGNKIKFNQILLNLLSNAIESYQDLNINNKSIFIKIKEDKEFIIIRIVDHGIGIKRESKEKIFLPFFSTKENKTSGMGIGLYSTKNIIEKDFQGNIKCISEYRSGTTMIIKIPKNKTTA